MEEGQEGEGKKKSGLMALVIPLVVLTAVGGGGGWVIGNMLAPQVKQAEDAAKAAEAASGGHGGDAKKDEEGIPPISTEANGVVALAPITTNLAYPSENWIRLEVALMFNGPPDVQIAEAVHQDIMAYLRTVSLQQVEGPRGFQYLKDDLQERVDLRSEGRVSKVMFRTLVIE
ncbi:flagellar basal body-associated FliL family protein [Allorhizobium sp. NPDC080224]|jgi:flagellar FliL protein|uniref:Flagellar protein FliL n=1 Tax=Rhizobium rosettiformans TaxID=1368430 RepID=A0ABX7EXC2_9HYPH|nr:flagellar basal body-associated FliL family protein [Rhizobium rosettiformans]ODS58015.1 MAG: flagellar basal body protein FliL [Agrobacterium sp. SCN 61-19]QRF51786.1 flagellar basal body protein FliL [Rhizobium rosettiformans]